MPIPYKVKLNNGNENIGAEAKTITTGTGGNTPSSGGNSGGTTPAGGDDPNAGND